MQTTATIARAQRGEVRHISGHVHCEERACAAVVSVVERDDFPAPVRFVLWCSLRACDACSERCLYGVRSGVELT